jgi:hypothetical protein
MLGEGRHWWITANSDSHINVTEGRGDFWPGQYSKTYVHADRSYEGVMDGLRNGRIFVTTGDLISELDVHVDSGTVAASIGQDLVLNGPAAINVTIMLRDPGGLNHHGDNPAVNRVDLIVGDITGPVVDRTTDTNPTTRVERRFTAGNWTRNGEMITLRHTLQIDKPVYLRVRGTSTQELEPELDPQGEDPWQDLWFYSNPVFIRIQ